MRPAFRRSCELVKICKPERKKEREREREREREKVKTKEKYLHKEEIRNFSSLHVIGN